MGNRDSSIENSPATASPSWNRSRHVLCVVCDTEESVLAPACSKITHVYSEFLLEWPIFQ